MKKAIAIVLTIFLLIVALPYGLIGWGYFSGSRSVEYQPENNVLKNSIYIDEEQGMFIGWNNAIIIVDGVEIFAQWRYVNSGFCFDRLEPQFDEDGKISACYWLNAESPIRGKFRYTKKDGLVLKSSLFYSQIFRGKRFVLQRYDMDAIDWDALPLSEEAVSWLTGNIEVEIKPHP